MTSSAGSLGLGSAAPLGHVAGPSGAGTNTVSAGLPTATAASRSALSDSAVPATPTALAATVVAMTGSGHSSTVLRLAPPDLGTLSIHVAYAADASVNLVFVPSTSQTAQLLGSGMDGLRHAMATAGLTLGQTQIGGGGGQAAGGGNGGFSGQRQTAGAQRAEPEAGPTAAMMIDGQGARAIA
jgi:flagellar hook-length control protein FliK